MDEFRKELASLLNIHGLDSKCNTPDWVLAIYLESCIAGFEVAMVYRDGMNQEDEMTQGDKVKNKIRPVAT